MRRRTLFIGALVIVAALAAPAALAAWSSSITAGPLPLSSATLAAPTGAAATTVGAACTKHVPASIQVNVSWTATTSTVATGYTIKRSTSATGPFALVGTVSGRTTVTWTDVTGQLALATNYYYVIDSTVTGWSSPDSNVATVFTPDTNCHGGT
jgi:hypothetical protein